jgi:shikimate kinase
VVLIGLPGSGKTVVGRLVADQLQADFVDPDALIVRREGKPIAMIFAELGESVFRRMEKQEVETALGGPPAVIAPGGGWAAEPGNLEQARGRCWLVYLKTRPETAAARVPPDGSRPLLSGADPVAIMRQLLKTREPAYRTAEAHVETDRKSPEQVAAEIARLARTGAEW